MRPRLIERVIAALFLAACTVVHAQAISGASNANLTGAVTSTGNVTSSTIAGPITLTGGTQTASNPVQSETQTWNNAGVSFVGLNHNFTCTACGGASIVEQWQLGGLNILALRKDGFLNAVGGASWNGNRIGIGYNASGVFSIISSTSAILFGGGANLDAGGDTMFCRAAAGVMEIGASGSACGNGGSLQAATVITKSYTVAGLPASPGTGARAQVTDATSCTFLGTLTGGGSTFCPSVYNGATWIGG